MAHSEGGGIGSLVARGILVVIILILIVWIMKGVVSTLKVSVQSGIYDSFAQCVNDSGAHIYGWHGSSQNNHEFSKYHGSEKYLPYVECSTAAGTPALACQPLNLAAYPTWIFRNGIQSSGPTSFQVVSNNTGCALPTENELTNQ